MTGGAANFCRMAKMHGRPAYKVVNADGWWYVMKNKTWDNFDRVSRHAREDLAINQTRRMIRRESA